MRVTRLRTWDVIDYGGEWEDAWERTHASFTCPVLAGLCAKRHARRYANALEEWDDYVGTMTIPKTLNATIGATHA